MQAAKGRRWGFSIGPLILPQTIWIVFFLFVPLVVIVLFSFWTYIQAGFEPTFTLQNYIDWFSRRNFIMTLLLTLKFTGIVMGLTLVIGYPVAYFLTFQVKTLRNQITLFLLCMVPFWTSALIRAVGWWPVLGRRGLINQVLVTVGIIDKPLSNLLFSELAVIIVMVQLYVVLMLAPIFFMLAKIPRETIEIARDMGASGFSIFRRIILPLSFPGIAIGCIFVFVMAMGEFATPGVIGGGQTVALGNIIKSMVDVVHWPFAAANAVILMIVTVLGVWAILKTVDPRKEL
jgi:putative spermidine/putrescine transport system permease protein